MGLYHMDGTGRLYRINGRMNGDEYCEVLKEGLLGTLRDQLLGRNAFLFQEDNDPKHTSKKAKTWFAEHNISKLKWAASSPDMSIIEHMWKILDCKVRKHRPRPRNADELWAILEEEWAAIDVGVVRHLYESMPRQVSALKSVREWHTKY